MTNKIAVVVCNYNKKDYVMVCVASILEQSIADALDIYVVDNASQDGSVEALRERFGNRIVVIAKSVNDGGSGGFNAGMLEALKHSYEYLVLADNDIRMDTMAVEQLHDYMEMHPDAGMAGAVTLKMDEPKTVMALGSRLDPDLYEYHDNFRGTIYSEQLPEVQPCDYVPACTLMVRREAIDRVGLMDTSCFMYWDDIDWAARMRETGYRIVALRDAKVWHKGGGIAAPTTAPVYYFMRNRIHFYAQHLPKEEEKRFIRALLEDIFIRMHGCSAKGRNHYVDTMVQAYEDGLQGVRGRADAKKLLPDSEEHNRFAEMMETGLPVLFRVDKSFYHSADGWELLARFVEFLRRSWPETQCGLTAGEHGADVQAHILFYDNVSYVEKPDAVACKQTVCLCENIRNICTYQDGELIVDARQNFIGCAEDFLYFHSFSVMKDMFCKAYEAYFLDKFQALRCRDR